MGCLWISRLFFSPFLLASWGGFASPIDAGQGLMTSTAHLRKSLLRLLAVFFYIVFAIFRVGEWRADEIDAFLSFFFLSSRMTFFA